MKTLQLLLFFICASKVNSQAVEIEWDKSFGGTGYEESYDLVLTPDSNIVIVGNGGPLAADFSDCGENYGYVILKINLDGELLWSKCYGGNNSSKPQSIINSFDGGFIIAGESYANDGDITGAHGNADFWVVKINNNGELEWQIAIGGSSFDSANEIVQNNDGDYLIVGNSRSIDGDVYDHHATEATRDILLAKISSSGELLWTKSYGGNYDDSGQSITEDGLGNFIIAGYSESSSGDVPENKGSTDFWVLKIDSSGNIIWSKTFGGSSSELAYSSIILENSIFVVGTTFSNNFDVTGNHGFQDAWVLKLNQLGDIIMQKCFGGSHFEIIYDGLTSTTSSLLLTGASGSNDGDLLEHYGDVGTSDFWIFETDTNLNLIWRKSLGGTASDFAYSSIKPVYNSYLVTGYTNSIDGLVSENEGGSDMWTVKLNVCFGKYFVDIDGDGYGDVTNDSIACNTPIGYVSDSTDCNDANPDIHPLLSDICNSIDDNCNGATDEDATFTTYYLDNDGDLFGDILFDTTFCNILVGYVENNDDCNDLNADINPLMSETCNGIDDNCNIEIDEGLTVYLLYADVDGDSYGNPDAVIDTCIETVFGYVNNSLDCNDTLATIYPGATELCNYLDDDCDGIADDNLTYLHTYQDADNDNFGNPFIDSLSCELPTGYISDSTDCNDTNPDIYPGAVEILNGLDDDCDQIADEGLPINELQVEQFSLYPNPAFNTIQINSNFSEVGIYSIYSSTGQKVMSGIWDSGQQVITILKLAQGMYLIQLDAEDVNYKGTFIKL